jgi:hypothetical protein
MREGAMTREQLGRFVEAVERLVRSDLVEVAGIWRQDIEKLKATYEAGLRWGGAADAAPDRAAWVSPDSRLLFHLPLDLAVEVVETARHEKSLDRAFGLIRRRGRPFDPETSPNLDLADEAFRLKYECRLSWIEVVNRINASRPQPIDERTIRKMVKSHRSAIYRRRANTIVRRLSKITSVERE